MLKLPLSLSLAGLTPQGEPRAAIAWAAGVGYRAVQLDGTAGGVRARELDRSARRDLASLLRRHELAFSGLDLWIPPTHFVDAGQVDRAVSAVAQALELAADLARLVGGDGALVSLVLPEQTPEGTADSLSAAADRVGGRIADHRWPARQGAGPMGVGIDPAGLLAAGADPPAEVSRLAGVPLSARLSDSVAGGRVAAGAGKLDVVAYQVALATKGYSRPVVVDLRGVRDQERTAQAALST